MKRAFTFFVFLSLLSYASNVLASSCYELFLPKDYAITSFHLTKNLSPRYSSNALDALKIAKRINLELVGKRRNLEEQHIQYYAELLPNFLKILDQIDFQRLDLNSRAERAMREINDRMSGLNLRTNESEYLDLGRYRASLSEVHKIDLDPANIRSAVLEAISSKQVTVEFFFVHIGKILLLESISKSISENGNITALTLGMHFEEFARIPTEVRRIVEKGLMPLMLFNFTDVQMFSELWQRGIMPVSLNDRVFGVYDGFKEYFHRGRFKFIVHEIAHANTMTRIFADIREMIEARSSHLSPIEVRRASLSAFQNFVKAKKSAINLKFRNDRKELAHNLFWFFIHEVMRSDGPTIAELIYRFQYGVSPAVARGVSVSAKTREEYIAQVHSFFLNRNSAHRNELFDHDQFAFVIPASFGLTSRSDFVKMDRFPRFKNTYYDVLNLIVGLP